MTRSVNMDILYIFLKTLWNVGVLKVPAIRLQIGPVSEKLKDVAETTDTAL